MSGTVGARRRRPANDADLRSGKTATAARVHYGAALRQRRRRLTHKRDEKGRNHGGLL
jgi:hypothetical protein